MSVSFKDWPVNKQFMRILVKPDTWLLNPVTMDMAATRSYVVEGSEKAMVIDTLQEDLDIRGYIEQCVTDKPLVVASTHSHGDHTENNTFFKDCPIYMTEKCWEEIQAMKKNGNIQGWNAPADYTPTIIKDGDVIDLGDRKIECLYFCGCHAESSIVYFDTKYGCVFTGDEFEGGQVLVMRPTGNNCIELYRDNLLELKKKLAGRATCICPAHNGAPIDIAYLDYMIEACEQLMNGAEGSTDPFSMTWGLNPHGWDAKHVCDENTRRFEYKGCSLVYNCKRIFYKDCVEN
ncbi:MAG: MBL fold metallo-hydrolase [Lachnospiraceae bacterium]|nr:MBL fold metallo-hydrolase [Lachnospiraceae bacterium]MBR0087405.1 MBL fold metallo-hydrolase [Lachnospiraceae bacterium]